MHILRSLDQLTSIQTPVMVAVGVFDGVHLGHQEVIRLCREKAHEEKAAPWVMTFDPHPLRVVQPAIAPALITPLPSKLSLLEEQKIAGCIVVPFTTAFAAMEPKVFLDHMMSQLTGLKGLVIGENWRFGRNAQGDVAMLRELAASMGFHVTVASPVVDDERPISSTRIRDAIAAADFSAANRMLGRPHVIQGNVIHGMKRGRRLGFPTANMNVQGLVIPPPGIYAAHVVTNHQRYAGAVYLPATPDMQHGSLEVHLIDFSGDLYGSDLRVTMIQKIRNDDRRFPAESDLIDQIRADVNAIRKIVA